MQRTTKKAETKMKLLKQQVRTVAVVLIMLKLFKLIQWHWLMVLSPLLFLLLFPVLMYFLVGLILVIKHKKS